MLKPISSLLILALLPAMAPAQQTETYAAWEQFLAEHGRTWGVSWNPATGTPESIYGKGLRVAEGLETTEAAQAHADRLLRRYAKLLGITDSDMVLTYSGTIRHMHYFTYGQRHRNLVVLGARADVRISANGVVSMFGSSAVRIPAGFDITPLVNAAAARAKAEQFVLGKKGRAALRDELMIFAQPYGGKPTQPVLAWEIEINELPGEMAAGKCYVNATDGKVLHFENGILNCASCGKTHMPRAPHEARLERALELRGTAARPAVAKGGAGVPLAIEGTVMAWTNLAHTPNDPLKNVPLANLQVTSSAGNAVTDAQGKFSIPYSGTANVLVNATLVGSHLKRIRVASGTQMSASASIAPGTPGTIQFGTATMSDLDRSQTTTYYFTNDVNEYVRSLVPGNTTQWARLDQIDPQVNINASCNAFYQNNTINFYNSSGTCNMTAYEGVIQHEWGHGLDDAFGGIVFTDGLSEGWADVITILRSQQPILGPDFYKNQTPNYVRTALNTRRYPAGGGTHQQGEVWMGWVWDVRTDIAGTVGIPAAQLITERFVIPTIVANAPNLERQVLEVFLLDDDDGNLANGTPHYNELERACIKRNINYPKISTGFVTHIPLKGTKDQLTARAVFADAVPITGSFSKVELTYDIGSGNVVQEMVPTGKVNEWVGLIPGVLSPNIVNYSILATHSTNKTHRAPEVGTYSYAIGQEDIYFSDDFEGANKGWTTGTLSGSVNDFALGRPSGAGGTIWNVSWRDPNGAFSGTKAWANNLGGAHAMNMSAYLRSPKLDLTGKTNIYLRYRRWLQVQQGAFDSAQIRLNNAVVWENDWFQHHLDTSWTKVDLRLAAADNNPNVQIDWTLTSDGGMELGGWNIDDIDVYSFQALPPPKVALTITPSQVGLGQNSVLEVNGTPNAPVLLLVSTTRGPTNIPGLPTLEVGAPFLTVSASLDNNGKLSVNFTAPTGPGNTGTFVYAHVLERTNATTITGSNPGLVLWGK